MTRRSRRLLTTATAGVTAALLLAGCGGGDGDKSDSNGKIAGADTGASTSASPSASASAAEDAGRPKFELPAGDTLTFTPEQDSDPVKDAVLKDNAEFVRALDAAIGAQNPRLPALEYYTEGEGAVAAQQWVKSFVDDGLTVTGTVRYYNRKVTVESKSTASLTYCGDESKGYNKVIKTGVVKKTKTTSNSYVAYGVQVEKNAKGVWELVKIASTRGADTCQP
ncbi:hypothetical protein AB0N99_27600 [Streptomyces sp. NPDC093272]|uniref:hypothetical protein n=1 Tax=unclassified Streptomyces TaxID=2593676 RepID=UPI00341F4872